MLVRDFRIPCSIAVPSVAQLGCRVQNLTELKAAIKEARLFSGPVYWLGEGSNIIPSATVTGVVIALSMSGIGLIEETSTHVKVYVGAGNNWHQFVDLSLRRGWFGLENLALIPGSVGAVPVQNVGAYGVEVSEFVSCVHVVDTDGTQAQLTNSECGFGYRESVLKERTELAIVGVEFQLLKHPAVNLRYPELSNWLAKSENPTPQAVFEAVCEIRRAKLPDPSIHANAGSFFKNPLVASAHVEELKLQFPQLNVYAAGRGMTKLSAAQLIDLAGGKALGEPGLCCWQNQPLVIVNEGRHEAARVLDFAEKLQRLVYQTFAISLQIEPQIWV